jgi:hypothetical protein
VVGRDERLRNILEGSSVKGMTISGGAVLTYNSNI